MANPEEQCPTCHSKISLSGSRVRDGESGGVPVWSGDPILTPDQSPLNGSAYRGTQYITEREILELQADRSGWEGALGIDPPTEFSDVSLIGTQGIEAHIVELRMSTERILEALESNLSDYFSLDADGDPQPPGPHDVAKDEWTDVARGAGFKTMGLNSSLVTVDGTQFIVSDDAGLRATPCLPENTFIRGIHIEDLRHPFPSQVELWIEVFSPATPVTLSSPTTCVRTFSTCDTELIITGDVHDYRLNAAINANTNTLTLLPPATSQITVSPNTLFNGESNFVYYDLNAGYHRLGGGIGQNTMARASASAFNVHKQPRKITAATRLELFFDYTFRGSKPSPGPIPPPVHDVEPPNHTHNGQTGLSHAIPRTFSLDIRLFSPNSGTANAILIQFLMEIYITSFQGSYIQYMKTRAARPGFTDVENESVNFTTISEPGDPFNGQQVVVIPFAPFIGMFDSPNNYSFMLQGIEALLDPDNSVQAFYSADADIGANQETMNATVTINGYRIREV